MAALILDSDLVPVPEGAGAENVGGLFLCGAGMTRGYLGLPEKTAAAFISNPFPELVEKFRALGYPRPNLLYDTGDLASRADVGGPLVFHGRRDNQVKIRGERIELGEVEEVLLRFPPGLRRAVVLARKDVPGFAPEAVLVAYVEAENTFTGDSEHLRGQLLAFARQEMPGHMVPPIVVAMAGSAWQLTASAKIDTSGLPIPDVGLGGGGSGTGETKVAGSTSTSYSSSSCIGTIIELVSAVSARKATATSSLITIGIDSINAIIFMRNLSARLGITVTSKDLMDNLTVEELARALDPRIVPKQAAIERPRKTFDMVTAGVAERTRHLMQGMEPLKGLRGALILVVTLAHIGTFCKRQAHDYETATDLYSPILLTPYETDVHVFAAVIGLVTVVQVHFENRLVSGFNEATSSRKHDDGLEGRRRSKLSCGQCRRFFHKALSFWGGQWIKIFPVLYLMYFAEWVFDATAFEAYAQQPALNRTMENGLRKTAGWAPLPWVAMHLAGLNAFIDTHNAGSIVWFVSSVWCFMLLFPFLLPLVSAVQSTKAIMASLVLSAIACAAAQRLDHNNLGTIAWQPGYMLIAAPFYIFGVIIGQAVLKSHWLLDVPLKNKTWDRAATAPCFFWGAGTASRRAWGIVADVASAMLVFLVYGPTNQRLAIKETDITVKPAVLYWQMLGYEPLVALFVGALLFGLCLGDGITSRGLKRNPFAFYGTIIWPFFIFHYLAKKMLTPGCGTAGMWFFWGVLVALFLCTLVGWAVQTVYVNMFIPWLVAKLQASFASLRRCCRRGAKSDNNDLKQPLLQNYQKGGSLPSVEGARAAAEKSNKRSWRIQGVVCAVVGAVILALIIWTGHIRGLHQRSWRRDIVRPCFTDGTSPSCARWNDTDGNGIEAHGGSVSQFQKLRKPLLFWYGTTAAAKSGGHSDSINCYSSLSIAGPWNNEGRVLAQTDITVNGRGGPWALEHPHVVFNNKTQMYVMWFDLNAVKEKDGEYGGTVLRRAGVALSSSPTGPFKFVHALLPDGFESMDISLFKDVDEKGVDTDDTYLTRSCGDDKFTGISRLTQDYLNTTGVTLYKSKKRCG
jgi:hypothetical protein